MEKFQDSGHMLLMWTLVVGALVFAIYKLVDRMPPMWLNSKKALIIGQKQPQRITSEECPYAYIRRSYGKHHWAPFVDKLSPKLKNEDSDKYKAVVEIMDAIHLCLMLVDDVRNTSFSWNGVYSDPGGS